MQLMSMPQGAALCAEAMPQIHGLYHLFRGTNSIRSVSNPCLYAFPLLFLSPVSSTKLLQLWMHGDRLEDEPGLTTVMSIAKGCPLNQLGIKVSAECMVSPDGKGLPEKPCKNLCCEYHD